MGLLKHAILPLFALVDLGLAYKALVLGDMDDVYLAFGHDTTKDPMTNAEIHIIHALGAALVVLFVNNVAAILVENSHYRGMAVLLQIIFFLLDASSYVRLGVDVAPILLILSGVGLVGLAVHSREPGIFTKDNKAKAS